MNVYAIVVASEHGFDQAAEQITGPLQASGIEPLWLSNPIPVRDREVAECDFEVHVFSHGEYRDTLDANDEPRDEQSALEHVVRLATSALGAVRDHVGEESWEDNTPSRALGRALDAWDEFVQASDEPDDPHLRPRPSTNAHISVMRNEREEANMAAPEGYREDNLLGNVIGVLSDRTGNTPEHIAHKVADHYGAGDFGAAEDRLWDRFGRLCDDIQDELGLEDAV